MDIQERLKLISRNSEEIINKEELLELLKKKKQPVVYLGWSITGRPHIGYYFPVIKLADFLKAGCKVKLLLADIHGALDKTPWDVLGKRYQYYYKTIPMMFTSIGIETKNFEIVKGSDFQLSKEYIFDLLKLSSFVSANDAKRAGSEVVKYGDNPKLGGLLYPLMQALDEEYLGVDIQYGGIDQRKILMFARENMPKLGYKRRIEIMTSIIPGLTGKKMSASIPESKVDLLDDEETVVNKLKSAYCEPGKIEENGILAFLKYVIMVLKEDKKEEFIIERPEKFGGNIKFKSYSEIEELFLKNKIHPLDLKNATAKELNKLLSTFRTQKVQLEKLAGTGYK